MGNSSSSQFTSKNLKSIKLIQNNGYGVAQLVSFTSHPDQVFVLKTQVVMSEDQEQNFVEWLQSYQQCNPSLAIQALGKRKQSGFMCSSSNTIEGLFEYLQLSLKDEITNKRLYNNPFKQKEVGKIIKMIVQCFIQFQSLNINIGYLDPEMILVTKEKDYKICIVGMLFQNEVSIDNAYLPPEQENINYQKYRVFMIGLIILQCLTLKTAKEIRQLSRDDFKRMINKILCSKGIKDLLTKMTSKNPVDRPNNSEILQQIQRLQKIDTNSKLNHSIQKRPQKILSTTASSKKSSNKKSQTNEKSCILIKRNRRQRNLLPELYFPSKE